MEERMERGRTRREKKAKRQNAVLTVFVFLLMAACGGIGGYLFGRLNRDIFRAGGMNAVSAMLFSIAFLLFVVGVAWLLQIYLHETGHLLFGLLTGYRFQSIRFGSLMLIKTPEGLKAKKFTLAGTGGQCLMLPPELDENGEYPTGFYNWGGCLMNLLLSAVCLIAFAFTNRTSIPAVCLLIFALVGIGVALMNGVPLSGLSNDGYNAMILRKNRGAREAFRLQLLMNYEQMKGKRISELPEEWFEAETDKMDNALTTSAAAIRFGYLIETKHLEEAEVLGQQILEQAEVIAGIHEKMIKAELLFLEIMLRGGTEKARHMYETDKKEFEQLKTMPSMQRILYAYYHCVEKDEKKAEEAKSRFEKIAKRYPNPADIETDREFIELAAGKVKKIET